MHIISRHSNMSKLNFSNWGTSDDQTFKTGANLMPKPFNPNWANLMLDSIQVRAESDAQFNPKHGQV